MSSIKQVLPPGLRSGLDSEAQRTEELTAGRSSHGTVLNVCDSLSPPF